MQATFLCVRVLPTPLFLDSNVCLSAVRRYESVGYLLSVNVPHGEMQCAKVVCTVCAVQGLLKQAPYPERYLLCTRPNVEPSTRGL